MKRYVISLLTAVMAGAIAFAAESISIAIAPRYPWNGKVDLRFTIAGDEIDGGYAAHQPGDDAIAGYRLKYVQSAGDVQLDTGVVPGSKNTIELKFAWESQPGDNGCLFCARGAALQERTFTGFLIGSKWRFDYNMSAGTESATPTLVSGKSVVIRDVAGTASVDGTSVQSFTESSFTVGGPIALFASYVGAPGERVSNYVRAKVYYFKIFGDDGTTLLHDFVPWEKDGVVGMYDMIAKRFVAPNVGTLTCGTCGPKYETSFTAKDLAGGTNLTMKTLYKSNGTAANVGRKFLLPGAYNWVWDAGSDLTSRWATYSGCVPTNSVVLFSNAQLDEITDFYAAPCGKYIIDRSNLVRGSHIKDDGMGKSVQFAFSENIYTKCVCVHLEQSGANVVGNVKWARYVNGLGRESEDFDANSAIEQTIATSDTTAGYGLFTMEARIPQPAASVVLDRVVVEGKTDNAIYYVKFNANGGTGTMVNESFTYGTAKALTANAFTRTGYTFQGWSTTSTGAKAYSDKQSAYNITATAGATVNLYAVWKANTYSVTFNANGGTGTMANESFTYGTAKALTANAFTRTGFTFQGWATSATGAKVYSDKQSVSNLTATADATVNLYGVWKANAYTVKFNANGGTGTMANESFTYGTAKALTANAFKRTNYTFQGWATSATGAKVYSDKQSVNNLTTTAGATVNLYAVWKNSNPLYMVIDLSGGSSATSYPVTYLDAVPSGGWTTTYKTTKLVLRRIDAGSFKMQGKTTTTLTKSFYIGVFELTKRQWGQILGDANYSTYNKDDYPACDVKYSSGKNAGAADVIAKLRKCTALKFDLPTEAQWEYACRAGTTTTYYWGNSMSGDYAWYSSNSKGDIHPVGTKKPNAWGLYDMSGNVNEWVRDWYGSLSYGTDPTGPSSNTNGWRVRRGGYYGSEASGCTSSWRSGEYTFLGLGSQPYMGFRLSLTIQ